MCLHCLYRAGWILFIRSARGRVTLIRYRHFLVRSIGCEIKTCSQGHVVFYIKEILEWMKWNGPINVRIIYQTLPPIQYIRSRRLWKLIGKNVKHLHKIIIKKSWKHCCNRRNCSFWAMSPFVIMLSKQCVKRDVC